MDSVRRFTQGYYQAPWRKQLQLIVGFLVGLVLVSLVAGIYLNVSARAVAEGHEVQEMQDTMDELELKIAEMETELAYLTSISTMEERAREMGFRPAKADEIVYVEIPGYTGRKPVTLAPPPDPIVVSAPTLPPAFTESLIDWFDTNIFGPSGVLAEVRP